MVLLLDRIRDIRPILKNLALHCQQYEIPIISLLSTNSSTYDFMRLHSSHTYSLWERRLSRSAAVSSVRRFVQSRTKNSVIVLEDLSDWLDFFQSEKLTLALLFDLSKIIERRGDVLVTSAVRTAFSVESLVRLKDSATIAIELMDTDGHLVCTPLTTVGRYVPNRIFPLTLKIASDDSVARVRFSPFDINHQTKNKSKQLLDRIKAAELSRDQRFQNVFAHNAMPMALFHRPSGFQEVNGKFAEITGYTTEELKSASLSTLIASPSRMSALRLIAKPPERGQRIFQLVLRRKNGTNVPFEAVVSSLKEGWYVCSLHDISSRLEHERLQKKEQQRFLDEIEREKERYKSLVELSSSPIALVRSDKLLYVNSAFSRNFNCPLDSALTKRRIDEFFSSESGTRLRKLLAKIQKEATPTSAQNFTERTVVELEGIGGNENTSSYEVELSKVILEGKPAVRILFFETTSAKKILTTIQESEQRLRTVIDHVENAIAILDGTQIHYANRSFCRLFGVAKAGEITGRKLTEFLSSENHSAIEEFLVSTESNLQKGKSRISTTMNDDGSIREIEIVVKSLQTGGRSVVVAFFRDVSDERLRAKELHQLSEELSILDEVTASLNASAEVSKILTRSLQRTIQALSFEGGGMYVLNSNRDGLILLHNHNLPEKIANTLHKLPLNEGIVGLAAKTQEAHIFATEHYPRYLPFKSLFVEAGAREICFIPLIARGSVVGFMLLSTSKVHLDRSFSTKFLSLVGNELGMTIERSRIRDELQQSLERYNKLIASLPNVIFERKPDGTCIFISPTVETLLGYKKKDFVRNKSFWLSVIHPDDKAMIHSFLANIDSSENPRALEYRILPRGKAEYKWIRDEITLQYDPSGKVESLRSIFVDIHGSKMLQTALESSEEFRTSVLTSIQEGVAIFDSELNCIEWNGAMGAMTGFSRDEVLGKQGEALLRQLGELNADRILQEPLKHGNSSSEEVHIHGREAGNEIILWIRSSPLRKIEGEIGGVVCIISDVSERMRLEQNVRDSEQVLRNVIDTLGDLLVLTDLEGRVLEVNREFLRRLGYVRTETVGREFPYPWLLDEEMGRYVLWIASLREKNSLRDFDMTWSAKSGETISMSLTTTLLRNSYGEPVAMLNLARDISERKKLEGALLNQTKWLQLINTIFNKANETLDFAEIFKAVADGAFGVLSFDQINVGLVTRDGQALEMYSSNRDKEEYELATFISLERTVSNIALKRLETVVIPDFSANEEFANLLSAQEGFRSQITIPFISKDRPLGTVSFVSKNARQYSNEEIEQLTPLVRQLGTVVERVFLFKQVSEDAQYIHNLLNSIESTVYTIDENKIIRESNKSWHQFLVRSGKTHITTRQGIALSEVLPHETTKEILDSVVDELLSGKKPQYSGELTLTSEGGEYHYHVTANPIIIEGRITGVVFVHTDITDIKHTEEELKERNNQLLLLNDISSTIIASVDITEIFESVVPRLSSILHSQATLLYVLNSDSRTLELAEHHGLDDAQVARSKLLPLEGTVTGSVFLSKQTLFIPTKIWLDERVYLPHRELFGQLGIEAMAAIPLRAKDRVVGVLDVLYGEAHAFDDRERQVLALIGNQLGSAMENVQLYAELREQIDRLTVLYELSQQLTATLEMDQILIASYGRAKGVLPSDSFAIYIYDDTLKATVRSFSAHMTDGRMEVNPPSNLSYHFEENSPEAQAIRERRAIRGQRQSTDSSSEKSAFMCVPMISNDRVVGLLSCAMKGLDTYSDTQLRLLESIGNLSAIALEKAHLYQETVQKSIEIQQRNKELDDFTYVVSHDLKEPLITIEGYSKMLLKDYPQGVNEEVSMHLKTISKSSTRMKRLIEDLLLLSRVGRRSDPLREISVNEVLVEVLADLDYAIQQKNVDVVVAQHLPSVFGNDTHLQIVFRNLIANAIKFNENPTPRIEIGYDGSDMNYHVYFVADNGIGIEKEYFDKIFMIFQRLHTQDDYEGTGAGLAIVKRIIELHHGAVWLESEVGKGSKFYFKLLRNPEGKLDQ